MFKKNIKIWIIIAFILSAVFGGVNTIINSKLSAEKEVSSSIILRFNQNDSLLVSSTDATSINLSIQNFSKVLSLYLDLIDTQNRIFMEAGQEERYSDISKTKLYSVQNLGDNTMSINSSFYKIEDSTRFQNVIISEIRTFLDFYNSTQVESKSLVTLNDENIIQKNTKVDISKGANGYIVFISSFIGVFFILILIIYFVKRNKND